MRHSLLLPVVPLLAGLLAAQAIDSHKISQTAGGFSGTLSDLGRFGVAMDWLSDLDGDGRRELLVGADHANNTEGEAWIIHLDAHGEVTAQTRIYTGQNGFQGPLAWDDLFGAAVARLGDVNGDGSEDIAVGAHGSDLVGGDNGLVWILFLDPNPQFAGRVISELALGKGLHGCPSWSTPSENFGHGLAGVGDLDLDGVPDLAVGADPGLSTSSGTGRVWILFLNADGSVRAYQEIANGIGGFPQVLQNDDQFGCDLELLGDLDQDGVPELAVGARNDSSAGPWKGAVYVLFMNNDGTVKATTKIAEGQGGFVGPLVQNSQFGEGMAWLGATAQLLVGAYGSSANKGAAWQLDLSASGMVTGELEFSEGKHGFCGDLELEDWFGHGLCSMGDQNGDGLEDVAVGAMGDDDGGDGRGAVYQLLLTGREPIFGYCYCDDGDAPCGNADERAGCTNSRAVGTLLAYSGSASVASDDLVLSANQVPINAMALFFMGGAQACPLPFGDGLLCVSPGPTTFCRYGVQNAGPTGTLTLGPGIVALSQNFAAACRIDPGESWHFQAWYRDPMGPCGSAFNLSNGLAVTFSP